MLYLSFLSAITIMYCVVCRSRPPIFPVAHICVFKERQARLSAGSVGAHWKADRSLLPTYPRNRPLVRGPRLTTSRGILAWAGDFAAGLAPLQPSSLSRSGHWLLQVSDMGTAVTGDGLHEVDTPSPITWLYENAETEHQDNPSSPSGSAGHLAQIPIDAAKPQGGDPATEMPCWEEAADVANRRGPRGLALPPLRILSAAYVPLTHVSGSGVHSIWELVPSSLLALSTLSDTPTSRGGYHSPSSFQQH
jgi:hypothetical protein